MFGILLFELVTILLFTLKIINYYLKINDLYYIITKKYTGLPVRFTKMQLNHVNTHLVIYPRSKIEGAAYCPACEYVNANNYDPEDPLIDYKELGRELSSEMCWDYIIPDNKPKICQYHLENELMDIGIRRCTYCRMYLPNKGIYTYLNENFCFFCFEEHVYLPNYDDIKDHEYIGRMPNRLKLIQSYHTLLERNTKFLIEPNKELKFDMVDVISKYNYDLKDKPVNLAELNDGLSEPSYDDNDNQSVE